MIFSLLGSSSISIVNQRSEGNGEERATAWHTFTPCWAKSHSADSHGRPAPVAAGLELDGRPARAITNSRHVTPLTSACSILQNHFHTDLQQGLACWLDKLRAASWHRDQPSSLLLLESPRSPGVPLAATDSGGKARDDLLALYAQAAREAILGLCRTKPTNYPLGLTSGRAAALVHELASQVQPGETCTVLFVFVMDDSFSLPGDQNLRSTRTPRRMG